MELSRLVEELAYVEMHLEGKGWRIRHDANRVEVNGRGELAYVVNLVPNDEPGDWTYNDDIRIYVTGTAASSYEFIYKIIDRATETLTVDETLRGRWRQKLTDLTAEGERLGFAMEYVAMLQATAKALSENALPAPTHRGAPELPF